MHIDGVRYALDFLTQPRSELARPTAAGKVECLACAHRCKLAPGARGVCLVRFRQEDALRVPWGYTAGVAVDPIEKKPFFHLLPGAKALSFGMLGCDMKCAYCQNWFTSQSLRDQAASQEAVPTSPEALVAAARRLGCPVITSTYNEPLITAEWAHDVFALAKEEGIVGTFVSNGHATPEVLDYLADVLAGYKVDLKSFSHENYRRLGGKLDAVKETIRLVWERGIWCEVVTLVVPGFNDSDHELAAMAEFLVSVSPDIPWHLTAFHPDYKMTDPPRTSAATLIRACGIGRQAGLRFVYAGNLPGQVEPWEHTHCPTCGTVLVTRWGFTVLENRLTAQGSCPRCHHSIPGRWRVPVPAPHAH
ncbi:MAG: AmmeMemoRadiSam system radical SAM enzyme [Thermoanaerobaculum sp.]|nr:AmmeMemoRadiSam system radical SAM enzyme [Thermoanaerobaculum sp.]